MCLTYIGWNKWVFLHLPAHGFRDGWVQLHVIHCVSSFILWLQQFSLSLLLLAGIRFGYISLSRMYLVRLEVLLYRGYAVVYLLVLTKYDHLKSLTLIWPPA